MGKMYERIMELCEKRGVKPGKMCVDLGLSRAIISDMKSGRTKELSAKNSKLVAEYLGVSVDYLLGKTDEEKPSAVSSEGFSDSDVRLLEWFRSLPEEKRRAILIASDAPEDVL